MGSYASRPPSKRPDDEEIPDDQTALGELLSGRLADVDIDSVEAVRDERDRE